MNSKYTGRQIAIFTDIHGLLEPLVAVLNDIQKNNIIEIYSLGDNIGTGPNPKEVLELLEKNNVTSIAGNSEEYINLGMEPFDYIQNGKKDNCIWTKNNLTNEQIKKLKLFPHTIELILGNKKIALCHFANDVRCDFYVNSTWVYQSKIELNIPNQNKQFLFTNSEIQKKLIEKNAKTGNPEDKGFESAHIDPLFYGKRVDSYDEIIQGHMHFKALIENCGIKVRTIRALAMGYKNEPNNMASYIILREKQNGYDVEEVLVPFDREKMLESIKKSDMPNKQLIEKYTK